MATRTENRRVNVYVNTPGAEGSLKSLRSEAAKLRNQLALLPKESKEFAARSKDFRKVQREIKGINNELRGTKSAFGNLKSAIGPLIGITAALAAGRKAVDLFVSSAQEFAGFEQALDDLQAITGAGARDMQFYSEMAKEVGRTTTLSAQQAVQAYKLIGSAKPELLENAEALAAVSREAIVLAEAAGQELPESAKALTTFLNQFKLGAEESSRVINVLAAGSKFGAGEIDFLTESVSKFGPAARVMNVSIEESASVMELMAKNKLTAEKAGISFRNILIELGSSADDINPQVVGLQTAIENLGKKQLSVTELSAKFGKQNLIAAQILSDGAEEVKNMTEKLTGTNVAYEQAAIRVDNLKGKWKQISSVSETIRINFGEKLSPAINKVSDSMLGMLNWINKFIEVPLSKKLEEDRLNLRKLELRIISSNTKQEDRVALIKELKDQYPGYLSQIDAETISNEDLRKSIKSVNDMLINKIILQRKDEDISKQNDDVATARIKVLEKEDAVYEVLAKRIEQFPKFKPSEGLAPLEQAKEFGSFLRKNYDLGASIFSKGVKTGRELNSVIVGLTYAQNDLRIAEEASDSLLSERDKLIKRLGITVDESTTKTKENAVAINEAISAPGTIGDPDETTNPIAVAAKGFDLLDISIKGVKDQINSLNEGNDGSALPFDPQKWMQEQAAVQGQLNEALMSDQEFSLNQTEQHYNKLIELGKKHGFNVVALEKKKNATLKEMRDAANSERIGQMSLMFSSLSSSMSTAINAFQGMEEGWLSESKGLTAIQIMIDTASAISSMIATAANTGGITPYEKIAAMAVGVAAVLTNMAAAKKMLSGAKVKEKSYYYGGSTGSSGGLGFGDRNGEYKGYVHDNEYVVSQSNLQIPWVTNITKAIDAIPDMIGSMDKGTSSSRLPTDNSGMEKRLDLLINIMSQEKTRPIAFPWRDIQDLKENGLDVIDKMENSRGV